jgi:VanZ family protein
VPVIPALTSRWVAIAGAVLLVAVAADSLVPVTVQIRTGLHWLIEHFLAYFALTLLFCLAWPRPFIVAVTLMAFAGSIEALQGLTSDRIPDLATAFCGAAGVAVGALLASLVTDVWQKRQGRLHASSG